LKDGLDLTLRRTGLRTYVRQTSNEWSDSAALTRPAMNFPKQTQQIGIAVVGWQIPERVAR
jgi:hypothetical protein